MLNRKTKIIFGYFIHLSDIKSNENFTYKLSKQEGM